MMKVLFYLFFEGKVKIENILSLKICFSKSAQGKKRLLFYLKKLNLLFVGPWGYLFVYLLNFHNWIIFLYLKYTYNSKSIHICITHKS